MKILFIVPTLIITVSACTSPILRTTHFPETLYKPEANLRSSPSIPSPRIGVPYYLPTALVPITITKEEEKTSPSKNDAPTSTPSNTTIIINPPADPPKEGGSSVPLLSKKVGPYQIKIGAPILAPDTNHIYFLEYNPSFATEDAITFGVGPNQLLESINATSTDKSGEALVTLAKIAADLAVIAAAAETKPISDKPVTSCSELKSVNVSTYLDLTLDKTNYDARVPFSLNALKKILGDEGIKLDIDATLIANNILPESDIEKIESNTKDIAEKNERNSKKGGVLFRVPEAYELSVTFENIPGCKNEQLRMMAMVPSKKLTYSLDVTRGALITKTTNLTVSNGMLTKIEVNKPSSLLGVLNVPLDIIKAILSAPAELLTLRIQKLNAEGSLTQAQADKYESELNKLKNAILLQNARHPSQ